MHKLFSVAVLTAGLSLAAASSAHAPTGPTGVSDLCYLECQYRCYYAHPGGGPAWRQCYITCGETNCLPD